MKHFNLLFISFLFYLVSCNYRKEFKYYSTGEIERQATIDAEGGFEGIVTHYYKNGIIKRETPFFNHHVNGIVRSYYPNGKLKNYDVWINGKHEGKSISYYLNGKLRYIIFIHDTVRIDTAKWYYPNGQLMYWARYNKNGRKVDFSAYMADGKINPKLMYPLFLSDSDSLREGQNYSFEIVMGNRYSNSINIVFKSSFKIDSVKGNYSKNIFIIKKPPVGINKIKATVYQHWIKGDTLWTNWYNVEHKFSVLKPH